MSQENVGRHGDLGRGADKTGEGLYGPLLPYREEKIPYATLQRHVTQNKVKQTKLGHGLGPKPISRYAEAAKEDPHHSSACQLRAQKLHQGS